MNNKCLIVKNIFKYTLNILRVHSIAIVAPYFNEERLKDGYFKRVKAVDDILRSYYRVYLTYENNQGRIVFEEHGDDTLVIRYCQDSIKQKLIAYWFLFVCGKAYCHSIWQVRKVFFRIPFLKVYVDVHGVVPEEEMLYGRYEDAQMYGDIEEIAVQKSYYMIGVTNHIIKHLKDKYGEKFKANTMILPIFDNSDSENPIPSMKDKPLVNGKFLIIYAGGMMKWQKIELMQDSIYKLAKHFEFIVATPKPEEFWALWKYPRIKNLKVVSKSYRDLCEDVYKHAHFGYVLRDDIIVNNVACPTKIPEYLKYGIIPIVNTPNVGDFKDLGMKYITLEDLNNMRIYSKAEISKIVEHNMNVLNKYVEIYNKGKKKLVEILK